MKTTTRDISLNDFLIAFLGIFEAIVVFLILGHGFKSLTLEVFPSYTSPIQGLDFWPVSLGMVFFVLGLTFQQETFETRPKSVLFVILGLMAFIIGMAGTWVNFAQNPSIGNFLLACSVTLFVPYWMWQVIEKTR